MKMKSTYNIADARDDIKELNDYLVELGIGIMEHTRDFAELEKLMTNPEFMRLMTNIQFFAKQGNKHMAEVYGSLAKAYEQAAEVAV